MTAPRYRNDQDRTAQFKESPARASEDDAKASWKRSLADKCFKRAKEMVRLFRMLLWGGDSELNRLAAQRADLLKQLRGTDDKKVLVSRASVLCVQCLDCARRSRKLCAASSTQR
jgi:hypothetical protein